MDLKPADQWKEKVIPALESKEREFKITSKVDISKEDIWQCLCDTTWKNNPEKRLYEIIHDIFYLQTTTYMDYVTIGALTTTDDDLLSAVQAITGNEES
ncbi:MAG TPA: post-transcriptional regulator [Pseudogracilibacillus sp.]|nr:post-transcriptional regulator [Pseudogracilibacillus sp.]